MSSTVIHNQSSLKLAWGELSANCSWWTMLASCKASTALTHSLLLLLLLPNSFGMPGTVLQQCYTMVTAPSATRAAAASRGTSGMASVRSPHSQVFPKTSRGRQFLSLSFIIPTILT